MSRFLSMAFRNVSRNRRRSAITLAAILLGVAVVLLLVGFAEGFFRATIEDVVEGRAGAIQVHRKGFMDNVEASPVDLHFAWTEELAERLRGSPHVTGVSGRINFGGLISNGRSQTMFVGRALDLAHEKEACPRSGVDVRDGKQLGEADYAAALLGYELAASFQSAVGATVNLQSTSPDGRANAIDVTVAGTTVSSFPFENRRVLTVPLKLAQDLLGLEGRVNEVVVGVDSIDHIEATAALLRERLGPEYEVHTWKEIQPFVRDLITRQRIVLSGISVVLFVIVVTGIINTMLMSVFERVREIGTMLAVGVRRRQVLGLFLLEAAVLGALGGSAGALVGLGLVAALAKRGIPIQLSAHTAKAMIRPEISLTVVAVAIAVSALGALLAAAWPAWKASRLNPVDALRST